MFWLDGRDMPLAQFLDASFAAMLGEDAQPVTATHSGIASPIVNDPYARSREALEAMKRGGDPGARHGWKLRDANPIDGGHATPTIAPCLQRPPVATTTPYRSTDAIAPQIAPSRAATRPASTWSRASWAKALRSAAVAGSNGG